MIIYIIFLIFTTICISIPITKNILKQKYSMDLLFLIFTNIIFFISTTAFLFYFKEYFLSFLSSFFLLGYSIFLIIYLKKENKKLTMLEIPYLIFTNSIFLSTLYFFLRNL